MEWSRHLPCAAQRQIDLSARGSLRCLGESSNHDHPATHGGNIEGASNTVFAGQPHFPQLAFEMLYVRLAQSIEPSKADTLSESQKSRPEYPPAGQRSPGQPIRLGFRSAKP